MTAPLQERRPHSSRGAPLLLAIARDAIASHLVGEAYAPPAVPIPGGHYDSLSVTLHGPDRVVRGSMGHVGPVVDLARAVADYAVLAATADPTSAPVEGTELPRLTVEIELRAGDRVVRLLDGEIDEGPLNGIWPVNA